MNVPTIIVCLVILAIVAAIIGRSIHNRRHRKGGCGCGCEDHGDDEDEHEEITCYIMKVITSTEEDGEEVEEFVPVDDALEAKLIEVATTKLSADDPDEEE